MYFKPQLFKIIQFVVILFATSTIFSQTTIRSQSFDAGASGYSDDLGYTVSSGTYVQVVNTTSESSPNSLRFSNDNGSVNRDSDVTFSNIDISTYNNVTVTISFKSYSVDGGEDLDLYLSYNGGASYTNVARLIDGDFFNESRDWSVNDGDGESINSNPYTFNVPAGNTQLRIQVQAENLDDNELFYIDNVVVNGDPVSNSEIDIQGNSTSIVDGDITPSLTDHTDFGSVAVASGSITRTFTILNTGTDILNLTDASPFIAITGDTSDFTLTAIPSNSIATTTGSTTFQITFDPVSVGLRSATISIANDDENEDPYTFNIQGTGNGPEINVTDNDGTNIINGDNTPSTAESTDFGNVNVITGTNPNSFIIENIGTADLTITSVISNNPSEFAVTDFTPSTVITAGSSIYFTVTFNPSATGTRTATISIDNDDITGGEDPYIFDIEGFGIEQEIDIQGGSPLISITDGDASPSVAEGTIIGSTSTGTPITSTFTIENIGDDDLTIGAITFSGVDAADFTISSNPATPITGGGNATFTVAFDPQGPSLTVRNAVISIVNNDDSENPYTFAIQGTAITPVPEINVQGNGNDISDGFNTISNTYDTDFGSLDVAAIPISQTFTIQNTGSGGLSITSITSSDSEFTISGITLPTSVAGGGGSITFNVVFDPVSLGTINSIITINNNDSDEATYTFEVEGIGTGTVPKPEYTAYYNNFDSSDDGWTVVTTTNGDWIRTNTFGNATEMGEGYFWRNSNYDNYQDNTNIVIESPVYDFTGLENLLFSIDVKYNTENNYDGMRILYSISGGAYSLLGSSGSGTSWYEDNVNALGSDGWNDDGHSEDPSFIPHSQFRRSSISLSNATFSNVNNVRFRIEFSSDGGSTADGVAFDNVLIEADPITPLNDASIAPANITNNLRLWLKTNVGIAVLDNANLTNWEDQAYDTALDKEDAYAASSLAPTYRDNATRNMNFNPVADFDHNNTEYMQGKGGYFSQDYFVVFRSDDEVATQTGSFSPGRQFAIGGRFSDDFYHEDPTGLAMGSSTARYDNEILAHNVSAFPFEWNSSPNDESYGRAYSTTTVTYLNHPLIVNVKSNASRTATEIYKNGKRIDNITGKSGNGTDLNFNEFNNLQYLIGTGRSGITGRTTSQLNGMLTEVISYTSPNSAINQQKIQSYLGIKYGVTLQDDASALADYRLNDVDYIDSQGAVIWDTSDNIGYNYDIAGIGRDDVSILNQKQSRSQNDESDGTGPTSGVLTIGLGDIEPTNSSNLNTLSNRQFLMWGNNNASLNGTALTVEPDMSEDIGDPFLETKVLFEAIPRIWKVTEVNGDIPEVEVSIPTSAVRTAVPPDGRYLMFISANGTFDPTADYSVMTEIGGNLYTHYDFDGTEYITFGWAPEREFIRSIYFDPSDTNYVDMEDALDLNPTEFTVSAWIKRQANSGNTSILSKRDAAYSEGYDFKITGAGLVEMSWGNSGAQSITSNTMIPLNEWHQVAVIYDSGTANLYIDGVLDETVSLSAPVATSQSFFIAAAGKNTPEAYFHGNIDEVRIWDIALSEDQLHYIMNQEIEDNTNFVASKVLPPTVTKNEVSSIPWSDLAGYYPMSVYTYTNTKDESGNGHQGALKNLRTVDKQTAPLPYVSQADSSWDSSTTWVNGDEQTIPGARSIIAATVDRDGDSDIDDDDRFTVDWNIVQISSNVNISNDNNTIIPGANNGNRNVLGLIVDNTFELTAEGTTTLSTNSNSAGTGNGLTVTHYLGLDGKIDLEGESQLIQTTDSDLVVGVVGELERDQQGTGNIYRYNDWSSPVYSIDGVNKMFTVADVLKDGSDPTNPLDINFVGGYNGSLGTTPGITPISIAEYWLYVRNAVVDLVNVEPNWDHVKSTDSIQIGAGFLMKGTGSATDQNYVFQGKPNNGDITITVKDDNDYLVGNPYPSAIWADQFIDDNGPLGTNSILGEIYFWDHFGGDSHVLNTYEAGHATYTKMGGVKASNLPAHSNAINDTNAEAKEPRPFIAVGQAFYVNGDISDGGSPNNIVFNNNQRKFVEEFKVVSNDTISIFFKPSKSSKGKNTRKTNVIPLDKRTKFRIGFNAPNGSHRQLLLGFDKRASDAVDYGFDGRIKELNNDDMYWELEENQYVIQATNQYNLESEFPLGIVLKEAGLISIEVDKMENATNDTKLFIKDNLTGDTFDITNTPFEITLEAGEYSNRFALTFQPVLIGLNELKLEKGIFIHMNNTTSNLEIKKIVDTNILTISLYNTLGQLAQNWINNFEERTLYLPVGNLAVGVYVVQITTSEGVINKKIIIE